VQKSWKRGKKAGQLSICLNTALYTVANTEACTSIQKEAETAQSKEFTEVIKAGHR